MQIQPENIYHVFNQGNRRQKIFFAHKHYTLFLSLLKKQVFPNCDILAFCLMPNHFHLLVYATEGSVAPIKIGNIYTSSLSNSFRIVLSTYTQILNRELNESGSLFRQKTKAKLLDCKEACNAINCFNYIHMNPVKAGLVKQPQEWIYSSYSDYMGLEDCGLIKKQKAIELLDLPEENNKRV